MTKQIDEESFKNILDTIAEGFDEDLFAKQEKDLEQYFFWEWDENFSVEWNTYEFYERLGLYNRFCRRWEEHKSGSCCIVERVRDKYLISKIRNFLSELEPRMSHCDKLLTRIAKLEEALRFYAEKDYIEWVIKSSPDEDCHEDVAHGKVARCALGLKEDEE